MAYVALSRVRKLSDMHVLRFNVRSIRRSARAVVEYNRLRSGVSLPPLPTEVAIPAPPATLPRFTTGAMRNVGVEHGKPRKNGMELASAEAKNGCARATRKRLLRSGLGPSLPPPLPLVIQLVFSRSEGLATTEPMPPAKRGAVLLLDNPQAVSCYANSAVQGLIRCRDFISRLELFPGNPVANRSAQAMVVYCFASILNVIFPVW